MSRSVLLKETASVCETTVRRVASSSLIVSVKTSGRFVRFYLELVGLTVPAILRFCPTMFLEAQPTVNRGAPGTWGVLALNFTMICGEQTP